MGIVAEGLGKVVGNPATRILADVNLGIERGEFVALTGRSGSGKSTLLHLLGSLDRPSEGRVSLDGVDLGGLGARDLDAYRNLRMGFVFQFHYLIAELSAFENVLLPARKSGQAKARRARAQNLLKQVGLEGKEGRLPRQLSGGEQQRVAVARALVMEPEYLFADEPTGALDSANGARIMEILKDEHSRRGMTVVLATHDRDIAHSAPRQVRLADGKIEGV
jgi:putative ABC transport system ATP-binding protein/lipoprotein-releasing system ATP-binding protein